MSAGAGHLESVVYQSGLDAVVALLDSGVGQSRQMELHPTRHAHLAGYRCYFQPVDGCAICFYQHDIDSFLCAKVLHFFLFQKKM